MSQSIIELPDQPNAALANIWGKYREFAATSRKKKKRLEIWRCRVLILGIAGAVLAVLCQETIRLKLDETGWDWIPGILGVLSALSLGLATYCGKELLNPRRVREWIRSRSMAEALKSQAYLYVTNTPSYDQPDKDDRLLTETEDLLSKVSDLQHEILTPEKKLEKILPNTMTVDRYLKDRVEDQINFYFSTATKYINKMEKTKKIGLVLGAIAVTLGALGFTGWTAGWVAVISTITSSIAAYVYAYRYQYLIVSYQATGNRLEILKTRWEISKKTETDTKERNQFICDCEDAISIENSAWMAELTHKPAQENE
ncbi:MAG: DUF4231 domain-containing protein [Candidatus Aminicenantes bacterium]|jgi:hypothetical protein